MNATNGVMMQFFHWYTKPDGKLWSELKENSAKLAEIGITAVWIPPPYKGNQGGSDVGYAVYDMYDLGEFDQKGSVRTKYGTKDELQEAVKSIRDVGIQVYVDVVLNHRIGGDIEEEILATPFSDGNRNEQIGEPRKIKSHTNFNFPGRSGKYSSMEWHWWHFTAVDTDGNNPDHSGVLLFEGKAFDKKVDLEKGCFDYLMGCDVDVKHPEVQADIKAWGAWYYDTIGMDGVRFDAVKHVEAGFFPEWLMSIRQHSNQPIFAVGEYWSYDVESLHQFIEATGGNVTLFDAPLVRNFADASKAANTYDLRYIFDGSLVKNEPTLAVTLVANHDTQPLQALENVVEAWFTPLAYAMILLRRDGYPCIFYADYYGAEYEDKGRDGSDYAITIPSHRFLIDKFLSVRQSHAFGEQHDYFDYQNCIGWVRSGDEEHASAMAVLLSNGDCGIKRMNTGRPNVHYKDVTGHLSDVVTSDGDGWAEFRCPAKSLSVWISKSS